MTYRSAFFCDRCEVELPNPGPPLPVSTDVDSGPRVTIVSFGRLLSSERVLGVDPHTLMDGGKVQHLCPNCSLALASFMREPLSIRSGQV